MNKFRSKEKRQLKKLFAYRKNYTDPALLLNNATKRKQRVISRWHRCFSNRLNTARPYPGNATNDLFESDYVKYLKIIHIVGLFHNEKSYWFRDQAVNFLINLYEKWQMIAKERDQEYFLNIWIFEKYFTQSQVVFALNKRIDWYTNMFDESAEQRDMPFLSSKTQSKLSTFNVTFCKDYKGFDRDDLDHMTSGELLNLSKADIKREGLLDININHPASANIQYFLDKEILQEQKLSDGTLYYTAHIDNIWVLSK